MRLTRRLPLLIAPVLVAAAAPSAAAQWLYRVDFGGAAADGPASSAPLLLDAALAWTTPRLDLFVAGGSNPTSLMPGGTHAHGGATFRAASWGARERGWTGAIALTATMARRSDFFDARRRELRLSPTLARGAWTISAEAIFAEMEEWDTRDAIGATLALRRDFGFGTIALGAKHLSFADTQTVTRDTTYRVLNFDYTSRYQTFGTGRRAYSDLHLMSDLLIGRTSWSLAVGARRQDIAGSARAWGSVDLLVPLRNGVALHIGAGRTSGVPEQRFEPSRFGILALRLTGGPREEALPVLPPAGGGVRVLVLEGVGPLQLLRVIGLEARSVEVRGDFTGWDTVPLQPSPDGGWQRSFDIPPGVHHLLLRIDEAEWQPPPDLPVERDAFGDRVGVLFVERR